VEEKRLIKKLPNDKKLQMMWSIATSTSIETYTPSYIIFANMLYNELNEIEPKVRLYDGPNKD
jgi:hypothetical protein